MTDLGYVQNDVEDILSVDFIDGALQLHGIHAVEVSLQAQESDRTAFDHPDVAFQLQHAITSLLKAHAFPARPDTRD